MRRILDVTIRLAAVIVLSAPLNAQDGAALFTDNCAPCHTIGEAGGVGPDLRDIAHRRDRAWLLAYVPDPASQNTAATMPAVDLSRDALVAVLDYIDHRSAAPPAAAAPAPAPEPAFTPDDIGQGRDLFTGRRRLANGGPACLSCHEAGLNGYLGGGTLGPSLTQVAARLNGPKGTSSWLTAPRTPVMRSMFGNAPLTAPEVQALTALFVDRARPDATGPAPQARRFVAIGLAGAAAIVLLIGSAWRGRLRPVRRGLIDRAARRGSATAPHTQGFRSGGRR